MGISRNGTEAAHAIVASVALAALWGCAHQQKSPAPPTPAPATTPSAPARNETPPQPAPPSAAAPPATAPLPGARATTDAAAHAAAPKRPAAGGTSGSTVPAAKSAAPAPAAAPTPAPAPAAAAAPAAPAALNLTSLEQRLRDTHAIGVFTKLSLKNQVDDLLTEFRDFYAGKSQLTLAELRRSYELLLMKVVSLLQDDDPGLASAVSSSREAIWTILSNRTSFNNL